MPNCKQCQEEFKITDSDLAFYEKISPTFVENVFNIPAPDCCMDCRRQHRLAWRNMTKVYKRKCDFSGKEIVSSFPPDSKFKVYDKEIWWSDKWDSYQYGMDVDLERPFLDQLQELNLAVPKIHSSVFDTENSDYTNNLSRAKDCYMVQNCTRVESCMYGNGLWDVRDSMDCYRVFSSEGCYECTTCEKCFSCFYSDNSVNCRESYFLDGCIGCSNCFGCSNLNNKQYYVYGKQCSREEFEKVRDDFLSEIGASRQQKIKEIRRILSLSPKKFANMISCESCRGDFLYHAKNVQDTFYCSGGEDLRYCSNINYCKSSLDHDFWGDGSEYILDCVEVGNDSKNIYFSAAVFNNCSNIFYSIGVYNGSHDCFGCVGLKKAEYCILNKKYTREKYEILVAKIIEKMRNEDTWGKFLPMSMSLRGYNETVAQEYYPLSKEEAISLGVNWQDDDFSLKYDGPFYEPLDIAEYSDKGKADELLGGVLKCEVTQKPYKVQPQELAFYLRNNIQIPLQHPDQRYKNRISNRRPMILNHRQCMCEESDHGHEGRCTNEFETTYAPDRPEKVYCEECYRKVIL